MHDFSLMGIDIGTSAVKVLLWKSDGSLRKVRRPAKESYVKGWGSGVPEQDPVKLWHIVEGCIRDVLEGCDPRSVQGVGLSGHGPSLMAADSNGDPVSNIITWMDPRPLMVESCRNAYNGPSFEATAKWIYKQLENAGRGEVREGSACVLQPKDYIGLRLTGEMRMDSSAASCMRWFSDDTGDISTPDPAGRLFPKAADPWEPIGLVTQEAQDATGLPQGIPVAAGSIDAFVEALGAGVIEPGLICDSTGTSTCISMMASDGCSFQAVKHVIPGERLIVAPVSYSGGCLAWAMSCLFPEVYLGEHDWSGTVAEALGRTKSGASGLVFLPYLVGKRSPVAVPEATGAFLGLRLEHTSYHMLRAVLEGCTYAMCRSMESWKDAGRATEIRAVGNGARHPGWLQMKAEMLNLPVASMKVKEGTVLGAAILGGIAAKAFRSVKEAVETVVSIDNVFMPEGTKDDGYRRGYAAFSKADSVLEDFWKSREAGTPLEY
ncbi:MAG: hypothetical protein GX795_02040 [Firmicutes bacterium]|jgi:xylulokinase|nr:hypothetical protein [Bacillota bacterium]